MTDRGVRAEDGSPDHARRVLLDLPPALWAETARLLRRALGRVPRSELPAAVRPFADWKPERLSSGRPRQVLAAALVDEPRLRSGLADELPDRFADADERDAGRLVADAGEPFAAAALAAAARWDDLSALAAKVAERDARARRAAGEERHGDDAAELRRDRDRLAGELDAARREQRRLREALEAARRRAGSAQEERDALQQRVADLEAEVRELGELRRAEHGHTRDREQRLRRRAERAESRAALDPGELAAAAEDAAALAQRLRGVVAGPPSTAPASGSAGEGQRQTEPASSGRPASGGSTTAVPRSLPAAEPGRPCRLPPGVRSDEADGVHTLLKVPAITVLVDGYNVTKHPQGRPSMPLEDQREWLVQLAGGVVARYRCRMVIVFDGTDRAGTAGQATRGVRVVFSQGEELADDRLISLLDGLDATAPACVVSSDREVVDAALERRADVVESAAFLAAVA